MRPRQALCLELVTYSYTLECNDNASYLYTCFVGTLNEVNMSPPYSSKISFENARGSVSNKTKLQTPTKLFAKSTRGKLKTKNAEKMPVAKSPSGAWLTKKKRRPEPPILSTYHELNLVVYIRREGKLCVYGSNTYTYIHFLRTPRGAPN